MRQQATPERMLSMALLASLIAGLVVGITARIIMRIVALTANQPPEFTAATLNIIFLGLVMGFLAGMLYAATVAGLSSSAKIRKLLPGSLWRGLLFGVLISLCLGLLLFLAPSSPGDDINLGIPLLNRIMFAALPLIYGITLGGFEKILDRYLPHASPAAIPAEKALSSSDEQ